MLWTIAGIILLVWLVLFALHVLGAIVHILLVIGLIVLVVKAFQYFTSKSSA